jgi:hypothetical protein
MAEHDPSALWLSAFYEQMAPLVLGGDPPFDWDQIKSSADMGKAVQSVHRDINIAAVMEQEVLSKHRKALMLMGTFHLLHNTGASAVSLYERKYPNTTFVISDLGTFDTNLPDLSSSRFAAWHPQSLARIRGTWMGKLDLGKLLPPPMLIDPDCNLHNEFPKSVQKPLEDYAVLYLGPQDLLLWEKLPADIALDAAYMKERRRREALPGSPAPVNQSPNALDLQILQRAENPVYAIDAKPPDQAQIEQALRECRERKIAAPPK